MRETVSRHDPKCISRVMHTIMFLEMSPNYEAEEISYPSDIGKANFFLPTSSS